MDLTLTEDQEEIRSTARKLLGSRLDAAGTRAVRGTGPGYSDALWREIVELGWTGLAIPERHGGVGAGFLEVCLLIEELGAAQVPSPLLVTSGCAAPVIERFGTDEQRSSWLPAIAAGRPVSYLRSWSGASVAAEPAAGGYRLHGTADYVPYAPAAEGLVVVAGTDDAARAFLLDRTRTGSGVSAEPLDVIGPTPLYRVRLDVEVPAADALGGPEAVVALDAFGAAATCAEMVGGAQRVLDLTVAYAAGREQFGRPIGSFQAVQHHCADMAIDVLGARFVAYEAIWRLAGGLDAALEVAVAKAWVSEAYQRVCARGQQVHGAIGFTEEHDLHLYLRHAMSAALSFGDEELHSDRIADRLGLPRTGGGQNIHIRRRN